MVDKKKESVSDMFNAIAPKYDLLNHLLSAGVDKGWRKRLVAMVSNESPLAILDLATGTADLAISMAHKCSVAKVIGGDISVQMLSVGQSKVEAEKLNDKITLVECDATDIGYESCSFDVVTCAFGVRNFENLDKGLSEMYRVCRRGGKVFILEFSKPDNGILSKLYMFYFKNVLPLIGRMVSKDNRAYSYLPESVMTFAYGREFASKLEQAGFYGCKITPLTMGIATIYEARKSL